MLRDVGAFFAIPSSDSGPWCLDGKMPCFFVSIESCSFISFLWRFIIIMKTWISSFLASRVLVNQSIPKLGRLGQWATHVDESAPASTNQKTAGFFSTSGINSFSHLQAFPSCNLNASTQKGCREASFRYGVAECYCNWQLELAHMCLQNKISR